MSARPWARPCPRSRACRRTFPPGTGGARRRGRWVCNRWSSFHPPSVVGVVGHVCNVPVNTGYRTQQFSTLKRATFLMIEPKLRGRQHRPRHIANRSRAVGGVAGEEALDELAFLGRRLTH